MLELEVRRSYKILYADGSEQQFHVLHASPAKLLIRVTTDGANDIAFADLLAAQPWSDIIELKGTFFMS